MGTGLWADEGDRNGNAGPQNEIMELEAQGQLLLSSDDGLAAANGKKLLHDCLPRG